MYTIFIIYDSQYQHQHIPLSLNKSEEITHVDTSIIILNHSFFLLIKNGIEVRRPSTSMFIEIKIKFKDILIIL